MVDTCEPLSVLLRRTPSHRRHLVVGGSVSASEPVDDLEGLQRLHRQVLPVAARHVTLGAGHGVLAAPAGEHVVAGEDRGVGGWTPEPLELARVGVGVPQPLQRDGKSATTVRVRVSGSLVTDVMGMREPSLGFRGFGRRTAGRRTAGFRTVGLPESRASSLSIRPRHTCSN